MCSYRNKKSHNLLNKGTNNIYSYYQSGGGKKITQNELYFFIIVAI